MDCREVATLLSRGADGELGLGVRDELEAHLAACAACREADSLCRTEAALISAAFRGGARPRGRGRFRTLAVAAVLLPLLVVGLLGLLRVYESAIGALAAARARAADQRLLEREVTVRANGVPLSSFVAMLAAEADVELSLTEGARGRLGEDPDVYITLAEPLRLRHVLGLLELFYGLRTTVVDGRIRLE